MLISRRNALLAGLVGGSSACVSRPSLGEFTIAATATNDTFSCGVASGDPAQDSVVLWTRIDGASEGYLPVRVEVATDDSFKSLVWSGTVETSASRDWTVKAVAIGLEPGQRYVYRFVVFDRVSPVGRTKTLPEETDRVSLGVASCSHYGFGYFNAYDHMARQTDLDAVLHLGDYIYEYGPEGYGGAMGKTLGRNHEPPRELLSLADYRSRHRQYKRDGASQLMHAAHPLIAVWDDHETSNDSFRGGAENHQPGSEGDWGTRKRAALQAYYEYMPVREAEPGRGREELFKTYAWGKYLTLPIIESRLTARDPQVSYAEAVAGLTSPEAVEAYKRDVIGDPAREMLGERQLAFLADAFATSVQNGATWRLIGNQVMMARVTSPNLAPYFTEGDIVSFEGFFPDIRGFLALGSLGLPLNVDGWDGYPAARERFYDAAQQAGARDLVVLTGDSHQFWANELTRDDGTKMGVELGTSGITSPGASAYLGDYTFDLSLALRRDNKDVRYVDAINNGYIRLDFEEDRGRARFIALSTIQSPTYEAIQSAQFDLVKEQGSVAYSDPQGLGLKERVLFG